MDLLTLQAYAKQVLKKADIISAIHENNRHLSFSEELHSKIPKSYAAYAVMILQSSMLDQELLKLCSIWETKKKERFSIPFILQHFSKKHDNYISLSAQFREFCVETRKSNQRKAIKSNNYKQKTSEIRFELESPDEPEFIANCINDANQSLDKLEWLNRRSEKITAKRKLDDIVNFRDKYVAHSLPYTWRDQEEGEALKMPKFTQLNKLYYQTITMAEQVHTCITQIHTPLRASLRRQNYKNATELWTNFELNINR